MNPSLLAIPFFSLKKQIQELRSEIDAAISRVLDRGVFVLGDEVRDFEQEFAEYIGTRFAVGVASGTDAITLALKVLGVGAGDEVITVSNTAAPTVVGICQAGATPVFADIKAEDFLIDTDEIEKKISSKTRAILPVHLYGQPVRMDRVLEIAKKHGLHVVEDACQAHGARFQSESVGSMGIMGCFSFYPTKNLGGFGDGGMITLNDADLYSRLLMLRNYGQKSKYEHVEMGQNSRLDELQAAILRVKLKYLDLWNQKRRELAASYSEKISHPAIKKQKVWENAESVYHLYTVHAKNRDGLSKWLEQNGVQTMIHYPVPVHLQPAFRFLKYNQGDLPITEKHARSVLSLPLHPQLDPVDLERVGELVNGYQG